MPEEMNSRERMLAAFRRQPVDRVPTDIWAVPEIRTKLVAALGEDWPAKLHIDGQAGVGAEYTGPPLPEMPPDENIDIWGVRRRKCVYDTGVYYEMYHNPLAAAETIDDLEAYAWPSADWFDYSKMAEQAAERRRKQALQCGYMAPFTYYLYLRGLENALTDPLLKPEFAHHLLGRLGEFFYEHHRQMFQATEGLLDSTQVTDDYGMQTGPMISMVIFEEFFAPHLKRFCGLAHEFGLIVFHHDDGSIRPFLPRLIELGIDVLNPIQWRCADMEVEGLKRDFGGRICFHGGIDNQHTLPFGSEADVRAEVRHMIDVLAADKTGYVLSSCHNIQALTPVGNILAMFDEAHRYGRF